MFVIDKVIFVIFIGYLIKILIFYVYFVVFSKEGFFLDIICDSGVDVEEVYVL